MDSATTHTRVTKSPEDRRRDLLAAAIEVFTKKGIGDATVADICTAAGVAKGTFYLYFESREHLLGALRESLVDDVLERANQYILRAGTEDWWALVDGFTETMIDLLYEQKDIILAFTREGLSAETADVFADCDRRLTEVIAGGIAMGVEAGAFAVENPNATAALIHHAVEGIVLGATLYASGLTRDQIVSAAKELVHKTLAS
jgi:AcrR family transcriptional regulator